MSSNWGQGLVSIRYLLAVSNVLIWWLAPSGHLGYSSSGSLRKAQIVPQVPPTFWVQVWANMTCHHFAMRSDSEMCIWPNKWASLLPPKPWLDNPHRGLYSLSGSSLGGLRDRVPLAILITWSPVLELTQMKRRGFQWQHMIPVSSKAPVQLWPWSFASCEFLSSPFAWAHVVWWLLDIALYVGRLERQADNTSKITHQKSQSCWTMIMCCFLGLCCMASDLWELSWW